MMLTPQLMTHRQTATSKQGPSHFKRLQTGIWICPDGVNCCSGASVCMCQSKQTNTSTINIFTVSQVTKATQNPHRNWWEFSLSVEWMRTDGLSPAESPTHIQLWVWTTLGQKTFRSQLEDSNSYIPKEKHIKAEETKTCYLHITSPVNSENTLTADLFTKSPSLRKSKRLRVSGNMYKRC